MIASSGERHRELMSLILAIVIAEQPSDGMSQELEPYEERCASMEQSLPFSWLKVRNSLEIERDRLLQGSEHFFEGPSLHRDIKIEADRLPLTVPAFGVAM
jgi:hypothetical protein